MADACSTTQARCYVPRASVPARHSERSPSAPGASHSTVSRLESGRALPSDPLLDAILDAYCVVTGVRRLELLERATSDWQRDEYGAVRGL